MQILTTIQSLREAIEILRRSRLQPGCVPVGHVQVGHVQVGFVPTMGALHAGHLSLVERARAECGIVVASLFVNPTQFAPGEDFSRYPRQPERDYELFAAAGVDLVFAPGVEEIYPAGAATIVDVGELGRRLDGAFRPGHFQGVATIVSKLFHIVSPSRAYFGQKDAAQVAVLRRMVRDLNFDLELVACPIVRDLDGLAMSSRNAYLTQDERKAARALPRTLDVLRKEIERGQTSVSTLLNQGETMLRNSPGIEFEFLEAIDAETLLPVQCAEPGTLFALAAKAGRTRLIDNFIA